MIPIRIASAKVSAAPDQALSLAAEGQIDDTPVVLKVSAGQLRQLAQVAIPWPVHVSARLAGNVFEAEGSVNEPLGDWGLALDAALHGKTLAGLNQVLGIGLPSVGPYRLKGRLTGTAGGYSMDVWEARLGRSDMAGSFQWSSTRERPLLKARARSRVIDLDELLAAAQDQEPPREGEPPFAGQPVPGAALRLVDLDLGLSVNRLVSRSLPLRNLSASVTLDDGLLRAAPLRASLDGHRVETELEVDARQDRATVAFKARAATIDLGSTLRRLTDSRALTGTVSGVSLAIEGAGQTYRELAQAASLDLDASRDLPTVAFKLTGSRFDVGALRRSRGHTVGAKGDMSFAIDLRGDGETLQRVLAEVNGRLDIAEGKSRIENRLLELWGGDLTRLLLPTRWRKGRFTDLNCSVYLFDLEHGVAQSRVMLFDTKDVTIGGQARIDLATEAIEGVFQPAPKGFSLFRLGTPIKVSGMLANPKAGTTKRRAVWALGKLAVGVVAPPTLLAFFGDVGTGVENPCVGAIAQMDPDKAPAEGATADLRDRARGFLMMLQQPQRTLQGQ